MRTSIITTHLGPARNKLARAVAKSRRPLYRYIFFLTLGLIVAGVFLAGCGNTITLQPTATRAPSASPVPPSATLSPSVAPSSSQSATPTRTAGPTHTARPPTLTPIPTAALIGGRTSKIAFSSCDSAVPSACQIKVMNADGSDVIQLTNDNQVNCCPAWSPDGSRIAFVVKVPKDDTSEIWVMNADGSNPTYLASNDYKYGDPAWSPDGTKIVFVAHKLNDDSEIKVINTDGSHPITLAKSGPDEGYYYSPSWSPDGAKIAFVRAGFEGLACQGCIEIFVMNADGSNPIQITDNNGISQNPAWSPEGAKIAYETEVGSGDIGIMVMNPDGSNPTTLSTGSASDRSPVWSPDGTKIAFFSGREHDWAIYVMNADGSNRIRLTNDYDDGRYPVWSPDGSKIAFIEYVKDYVYVMNADGSGLTYTTLRSSSLLSWLPTIATPSTSVPDCTSGWTHLTTGIQAKVSDENTTPNRVRSGPGTVNEIIAKLNPGTVVKILEGPVCADGLVFWKVDSDLIPGGVGWTAEGDGTEYYLLPYQP